MGVVSKTKWIHRKEFASLGNTGTFALSGDSLWNENRYDHLTTPCLRDERVVTVVLFRIF